MLVKSQRQYLGNDVLTLAARLNGVKSRGLSRFFPLLLSNKGAKRSKERWKLKLPANNVTKEYVILIFVSYKGWKRRTRSGKVEEMELTSVRNDARIVLDHLNYRHGDTSRDWYFIMDFDLEYTDWTGVTKLLPRTVIPTRNALLRTVREASRGGSSGYIHVGAHCMYGPPGTSHLSQTKVYTEQPTEQSSTNAAYFISCDGQRIYGKDFYSCLSDHINDEDGTEHGSTLTLLFDMCDAATFFDDVISLSSSMAQPSNDFVDSQRSEHSRSRRQLVVIYAAQKDQTAGTVNLDHRAGHRYLVGAATYLITGRLQTHPSASATDVFEYVNECCNGRKEEHLRQNPSIVSRYPISGPLRLLPSSTVGTIARIPADRNTSAPGLYPTLKSPIFGYSRLIRPHRIPFFGTLN